MRTAIWVFATTSILISRILYAQAVNSMPLQARPIRIVSCDRLPNDLNFEFQPVECDPDLQIDYLIEGDNIIAIKDDSLVLDFIHTEEGSDISKYPNGKEAYEQGSFPEVSEDGRYGVFSIEVNQNQWRKVDNLSIQGKITIITASKFEEKDIELSINDQQEKTIGPFSISIDSSEDSVIGIKLTGLPDSLIEVKLVDAGQELDSENYMSTFTSTYAETTFFFPQPKSNKVLVKVSYWVDLQEQEVILNPVE